MSDAADIAAEETGFGRTGRWVGLILGPALALGLQFMPPPDGLGDGAADGGGDARFMGVVPPLLLSVCGAPLNDTVGADSVSVLVDVLLPLPVPVPLPLAFEEWS